MNKPINHENIGIRNLIAFTEDIVC